MDRLKTVEQYSVKRLFIIKPLPLWQCQSNPIQSKDIWIVMGMFVNGYTTKSLTNIFSQYQCTTRIQDFWVQKYKLLYNTSPTPLMYQYGDVSKLYQYLWYCSTLTAISVMIYTCKCTMQVPCSTLTQYYTSL